MSKSSVTELYSQPAEAGKPRACLVVVPGVGTTAPEGWRQSRQQPWLDALVQRLGQEAVICTVIAVYHGLSVEKLRSWNELRIKGNEVLECIEYYRYKEKMANEPLVLVGHSLGGILIKQVLVQAWRSQRDHEQLLEDIQGVVFLSTPHLSRDVSLHWRRPLGILLAQVKKTNKDLTEEAELKSLARVSELFEDLTLPISILSIWEAKPTKLKGTLVYTNGERVNKCVLVDKHLARTSAGVETLASVETDHGNSCMLEERSLSRQTLIDFVDGCLKDHFAYKKFELTQAHDRRRSMPPLMTNMTLDSESTFESDPWTTTGAERSAVSLPDIVIPPQRPPDPLWNYHLIESGTIVKDYVAREDVIKRLDTAFSHDKADQQHTSLVVMYGIGGVGKTSVAAEYLEQRKSRYDTTLWVRADDADKVRDTFARIAVEMQLLDISQTRDRIVTQRAVLDWLENPVKSHNPDVQLKSGHAKWLMVFDNVEDDQLLDEFFPQKGGGSLIVTTRDPDIGVYAQSGRIYKEVPLKPFRLADAVSFLSSLVPSSGGPDHTAVREKVAERLDCMPLALRQMGNYAQRRRMSLNSFLDLYNEEADHKPLHATWDKRQSSSYEHNLSTVFAFEKLSGSSRKLLNVLALIDPDHIKEDLLVANDLRSDPSYPASTFEYVEARTELWRCSLLSRDEEADELNMHRTVQDNARATMSPAEYALALETACELLLVKWPVKERLWHYAVDHWQECQALCLHVNKVYSHVQQNRHIKGYRTQSFGQILTYAGWYSHERGDFLHAKTYFDAAEVICTELKQEDMLADLWLYQGCVATETNDGDAVVSYYSKLLARSRKITPNPTSIKEINDLAISTNEMGIGHMMKDQIADGQALFEETRDRLREHRTSSETTAATYMFASANLGLAHWLNKRWDDALSVLETCLQEYEAMLRDGEPQAFIPGRLMHAIGNVKVSQALSEEPANLDVLKAGFAWHQKASNHYLKTIGEDHHRSADVAYRVADDYMKAVSYCGADKTESYSFTARSIDRALKVFSSKPCYVPERMRALHLKAEVYNALGREGVAVESLEELKTLYDEYARTRGLPRADAVPIREDLEQFVTFWSR